MDKAIQRVCFMLQVRPDRLAEYLGERADEAMRPLEEVFHLA